MTQRQQPLCPQAGNPGLGQAWMCIAILFAMNCVAAPVSAQNCTASQASTPQIAVADLETLLATCSSSADLQAMTYKMRSKYGDDVILGQASVAGSLAIPVLRQFASLPQHNECTSSSFDAAARTALAKLGDENAYAAIEQQWAQHRAGPYPARIDFIGNNSALRTLVDFLIRHANHPAMIVQSGPSDGPFDVPQQHTRGNQRNRPATRCPGSSGCRLFAFPTLRSGRHGLRNTKGSI